MTKTKQRVGITASAFDLLHAGHVLMLKEARTFACDYLIVCLHSDPSIERSHKNSPVQSLEERYIQLEAVKYVDEIRIYDTEADLLRLLDEIRPDVRIVGEEYRNVDFTGKTFCQENNIALFYNSRDHNFSSSELRKRVAQSAQ